MAKNKILLVDDDKDIAQMLGFFFIAKEYDFEFTTKGQDALDRVPTMLPQVILLDINLPDVDGYAVCKQLRTNSRTKHIPVIFLTEKDDRADRLAGLELGADDYITKPFDLDELGLRVSNSIRMAERMGLTDTYSGLPGAQLVEEELRAMLKRDDWAYLDIKIEHYDAFKEKYGFVAGNEILRFMSLLLNEVVSKNGTPSDFIGHPGGDTFAIITSQKSEEKIVAALRRRFEDDVKSHYSFADREKGGIMIESEGGEKKLVSLMELSIGSINATRKVNDIREVTEVAIERRRQDKAESKAEKTEKKIFSWRKTSP